MRYWLYKSEPDAYGIEHLRRDGTTVWDGVRNFQARNNLMAARIGDRAFFYHSNATPPGVAGLMQVVETTVTDPTQFDPDSRYFDPTSQPADPRWITVRVEFLEAFEQFLPLPLLRQTFSPKQLPVLARGSRLSVSPVPPATARRLLELSGSTSPT
ncbi:MAG TPA: EVE domain-containing protein [Acidimicrobiia bacterium]|nr:EVE domain-containing protein [Acidimicrobiia bacterium]